MMWRLVLVEGNEVGTTFSIAGESIMGRSSDCSIFLKDSRVSRRHLRLFCQGEEMMIEDLGSRNGTYLNGKKVKGIVQVSMGDKLSVGDSEMVFYPARKSVPALYTSGVLTIDDCCCRTDADNSALHEVVDQDCGKLQIKEYSEMASALAKFTAVLAAAEDLPALVKVGLADAKEFFSADIAALIMLDPEGSKPVLAALLGSADLVLRVDLLDYVLESCEPVLLGTDCERGINQAELSVGQIMGVPLLAAQGALGGLFFKRCSDAESRPAWTREILSRAIIVATFFSMQVNQFLRKDGIGIIPMLEREEVSGECCCFGSSQTLADQIRELEIRAISRALKEEGRKIRAAKRLGISRPTLDRKIEAYGIAALIQDSCE